jgi:hypothetical protein
MVGIKEGGSAIGRSPKALVSRGKGKTFGKSVKPFGRGVVTGGKVPSSRNIFNAGMQPEIPTSTALKSISGKGAVTIPTRKGKRRKRK